MNQHRVRRVPNPNQRVLRQPARRLPLVRRMRRALAAARWRAIDAQAVTRLRVGSRRATVPGVSADVVVSLTSFPERIAHAWIPIETMLRQERPPDRVVLVLSEVEFPSRELPRKLVDQQRRGLEVLWIADNHRQYNKLIPVRLAFPDAAVITIDDDMRYEPWLVSRLVDAARHEPGTVIGHRGWEVQHGPDGLAPYSTWPAATPESPSERVLLTGVGGVLYPPGTLPVDLVADMDLAMELCPSADDIWLWAVERVSNVPLRCLGNPSGHLLHRHGGGRRLFSANGAGGQNDVQLARVVRHFGIERSETPRGTG